MGLSSSPSSNSRLSQTVWGLLANRRLAQRQLTPMQVGRKEVAVYRAYDIFEVMSDGSSIKRAAATGLEFAKLSLEELAGRTTNECFAADRITHQVVAQVNLPLVKRSIKRVFQIAYDEESRLRRTELLLGCGYGVISVLGNEAAKILLRSIQHYDLFMVGPAATEERRQEMVDWLKENYPTVKILALNSPPQHMAHADYNVIANGPESWLPIVTERLAKRASVS